jgi:hypothetical protein
MVVFLPVLSGKLGKSLCEAEGVEPSGLKSTADRIRIVLFQELFEKARELLGRKKKIGFRQGTVTGSGSNYTVHYRTLLSFVCLIFFLKVQYGTVTSKGRYVPYHYLYW